MAHYTKRLESQGGSRKGWIALAVAAVVGVVFFVALRGGGGPAVGPTAPPADSVFREILAFRSEGFFEDALGLAQEMAVEPAYAGTPWADSASALVVALQDTIAIEEVLGASRAKWTYSLSNDPADGADISLARIASDNSFAFLPPNDEPQFATLSIRDHPRYARQIYFEIERGSIICSSLAGCDIGIQFDDGPMETWRATRTGDFASNMIFIEGYEEFVPRLRTARIVRIRPEIFQQVAPLLEFDVGGFVYELYGLDARQ